MTHSVINRGLSNNYNNTSLDRYNNTSLDFVNISHFFETFTLIQQSLTGHLCHSDTILVASLVQFDKSIHPVVLYEYLPICRFINIHEYLKHNSQNALEANMFPVINVKSFLPAIEGVICNMIEQGIAFKAVEKLHHKFGSKYMYYMTF